MDGGSQKLTKPYGLWPSPITAEALGQQVRIEDVLWDGDGQSLVWLEWRSGHSVLVTQKGNEGRRDLTTTHSVRGGVGYGGGAFGVHQGQIFFAEKSGVLYAQSLSHEFPRPITPAYGGIASPTASPDGKWVAYVFSDGKTDLIGLVDSEGAGWPVKLVSGSDFYMQPAWHPSGSMLAWVEWNHPNMPWDGTRIVLGHLSGTPPLVGQRNVVGGGDQVSAYQPAFSPDGRWLCFVEANQEWENLVLVDVQSGQRRILLEGKGFHLATPAWNQGHRSFGWSPSSQAVFSIRNASGTASLYKISLDGREEKIDTAPYEWINQISVSPVSEQVAFLATAPSVPNRMVLWDGNGLRVIVHTETESLSPAFFPVPAPLRWRSADGSPVYGTYYPPLNPGYTSHGLPPAIISVHGGPTGEVPNVYSAEALYFTSRGYAFVFVNYRGSTGFGRTYRDALRGHWGDYDVEDSVSCARWLVEKGLADGKRLIIHGGSAGGYTVLNALARYPGVFKAGVCLYGVSSLFTLDLDTHKFEQHYTHFLVGELPEAAEKYHAWSPIYHAEKISDPIIVFQGSEDKVVTPIQSEEIVAALQRRGIPHQYRLYEGEGHGFRKSENIADYLKETERFLIQYVLFAP